MSPRTKYRLILGLLTPLAWLPFWVLYLISDLIYFILYRIAGYRKRVVRENLTASFPDRSPQQIDRIEREFYRHFADLIVETVKLLHFTDRQVRRRIETCGYEELNRTSADGRPLFIMLGHYGNWEWVPAVTLHCRKGIACGQIYRQQHDPAMDWIMLRLRSRFGTFSIPQAQAFRSILRRTHAGEQLLMGFIADQRPNSENLNHWTEFLHQDTAYAPGGEEIGRRIDAHYYYLDVDKTRRGHYRMTFRPIVPDADLIHEEYPHTLQFMRMLQSTIERQPAYWLWSHKRWSIKRPAADNVNKPTS